MGTLVIHPLIPGPGRVGEAMGGHIVGEMIGEMVIPDMTMMIQGLAVQMIRAGLGEGGLIGTLEVQDLVSLVDHLVKGMGIGDNGCLNVALLHILILLLQPPTFLVLAIPPHFFFLIKTSFGVSRYFLNLEASRSF